MSDCVSCGAHKTELHHIKTRGARPEYADKKWNHMRLCRPCHTRAHSMGLNNFYNTSLPVQAWLLDQGWELDEFTGKWWFNEGGWID